MVGTLYLSNHSFLTTTHANVQCAMHTINSTQDVKREIQEKFNICWQSSRVHSSISAHYNSNWLTRVSSRLFCRIKKRVVFADDKGKSLTEVRYMKEPSNVPPLWSLEFLAQVTQGLISPELTEEWMINFRQPASDYVAFRYEFNALASQMTNCFTVYTYHFHSLQFIIHRQKLDSNHVSLENVIIKENDSIVVGTVKVKNVSYHKEVIVRTTWDNWKSQEDIFCTYSPVCNIHRKSSLTYVCITHSAHSHFNK